MFKYEYLSIYDIISLVTGQESSYTYESYTTYFGITVIRQNKKVIAYKTADVILCDILNDITSHTKKGYPDILTNYYLCAIIDIENFPSIPLKEIFL